MPGGSDDGSGRLIQNVLPSPSTLLTPNWPPISATSWRAIVVPSPVPP